MVTIKRNVFLLGEQQAILQGFKKESIVLVHYPGDDFGPFCFGLALVT